MRFATLLVFAAAFASFPSSALADRVEISQQLYDVRTGAPSLVANHTPDGSRATPRWRICTDVCGPEVTASQSFLPDFPAPGTTFEASTTVNGETTTARSDAWTGLLKKTALPTITGTPAIGQTLTAEPGAWAGGWAAGDSARRGFYACPTPAGDQDCRAVDPNVGAASTWTVTAPYAGWWIGAVEFRDGRGAAFPASLPVVPTDTVSPRPAPKNGPTVARGPLVGPVPGVQQPVEPAIEPPKPKPIPSPRLKFRQRLKVVGKRIHIGTLTCGLPCEGHATVSQGRTKHWITVKAGPKPGALTVPRKKFDPDRALKFSAGIDGQDMLIVGTIKRR